MSNIDSDKNWNHDSKTILKEVIYPGIIKNHTFIVSERGNHQCVRWSKPQGGKQDHDIENEWRRFGAIKIFLI